MSFPPENDSPEVAAAKQAKLLGKQETPVEPQIAEYVPPAPIDVRFTGRIRPEWKGKANESMNTNKERMR
jgi:hypothetical protein